jgi:anti-anti-sigma factor
MSAAVSQRWLEIKQVGPVTVATFTQAIMFNEEEIDCVGEQLQSLIQDPSGRQLVLNFSAVEHIASHFLGELIVLHKKVLTAAGRLALCEFNPPLRETFEVLRLTCIFNVYDTEEEALRSFASAS